MWNVSFAWGAAEWGMCHAAQEYFSRRCHRSTQKPCRVLLSKNTDCTDAHGWVFSRILYSCSAAYRLVLMRRRRNGLPRIFSQAEGALRSEKSVEICGICGRQLSAQCAKEQAGCFYSPTDLSDKHRCHAGCFYQKTRIAPMRTDGSFHGFFTLAPLPTAWF